MSIDSCGLGQVKARFRAVTMSALMSPAIARSVSSSSRTRPPSQSCMWRKCQSQGKHAAVWDAKYETKKISYLLSFFLLYWAEWPTRGRQEMYASGCWNSFLEYSYIRFTKGQQVTQRHTEVTGQFTKSDSRYPNTSLFGLNSFKSLSYAVKSSGKHLLEAWRLQASKME